MGRISAPFGVKGWVKVQPDTAAARNLLAYKTWWIGREGDWRETAVTEAKVQGREVVARLEGCSDRDAAAAWRGQAVAVPRAQLPRPQPGEYYWADLIGLAVVNTASQDLGRIAGVMQTGANDVLVVEGERERLIPFIVSVNREVDPDAGMVRVDWSSEY
jgi:16S rRNA processing protein RimM